jgi:hypothetical protein
MRTLGEPSGEQEKRARWLAGEQRLCLYNMLEDPGYEDLYDRQLHTTFMWRWRNKLKLETPPASWVIPSRLADTGVPVRIRSLEGKREYMTAPNGIGSDKEVACGPLTPLRFVQVPTAKGAVYRVSTEPGLFLSYWLIDGSAKLYASPQDADFKLTPAPEGVGMWNDKTACYLWLKDWRRPTLTKYGDPQSRQNARWSVERVP